ncbi:MAG: hypothetical protein ABSB15_01635 [Bryobacteraceae bacterium]|jgi:hypothetical protein
MKPIWVLILGCSLLGADPVLQKFSLWGDIKAAEKSATYAGWTNGFFTADHDERAKEFYTCLSRMSNDQALATIDKHYRDHPERWSNNLGSEIFQAVTVSGGPCEGKNPLSN